MGRSAALLECKQRWGSVGFWGGGGGFDLDRPEPTTGNSQHGALLPGDGGIRMRQRYHRHPKFPSSSPVRVRQLLYRLAPSLGLGVRAFRPDVLPSDAG